MFLVISQIKNEKVTIHLLLDMLEYGVEMVQRWTIALSCEKNNPQRGKTSHRMLSLHIILGSDRSSRWNLSCHFGIELFVESNLVQLLRIAINVEKPEKVKSVDFDLRLWEL